MLYFRTGVVIVELALLGGIAATLLEALTARAWLLPTLSRRAAGDALLTVAVLIFIASGLSKLLYVAPAVAEMTLLGLTGTPYVLVAALEVFCGLLLLVKPLRSITLLFVSAHLGGAVCAHLIAGQYFAMLPTIVILSICWLGAFLRHPEMLWSLATPSRERSAALPGGMARAR